MMIIDKKMLKKVVDNLPRGMRQIVYSVDRIVEDIQVINVWRIEAIEVGQINARITILEDAVSYLDKQVDDNNNRLHDAWEDRKGMRDKIVELEDRIDDLEGDDCDDDCYEHIRHDASPFTMISCEDYEKMRNEIMDLKEEVKRLGSANIELENRNKRHMVYAICNDENMNDVDAHDFLKNQLVERLMQDGFIRIEKGEFPDSLSYRLIATKWEDQAND